MSIETDFAGINYFTKIPNWLRWLLVLPTSFITSLLISGLWGYLTNIFFGVTGIIGFLARISVMWIGSVVFIFSGVLMAPNYQKFVSKVLFVILTFTATLNFLALIYLKNKPLFNNVTEGLVIIIIGYFSMKEIQGILEAINNERQANIKESQE
jgi:hypothetical protein